jgi:nucleotide-binding universal stress UspA family protein
MSARRPLGNVLVATDFSVAAARAVERAASLPIGPGSTLTVLHVVAPGCPAEERGEAEAALASSVSAAAASVARAGREDVQVLPRLVEGTPFVEIVRGARHGRNELIVVGRHGERTFRELLLGSTAERVIRKGDTSILVVAPRPVAPYARPLVAVDCSDTSRRAVELAWRLAGPGVQALDVVHAYEPIPPSTLRRASVFGEPAIEYRLAARQQTQSATEAFLAAGEMAPPTKVVVREGDARQVILDLAAQCDADLVALGTHGRSGLPHVLLGSVAEAVIRGAGSDVLVARVLGLPFKLP